MGIESSLSIALQHEIPGNKMVCDLIEEARLIKKKYPLLDNTSYFPPRRPEDDQFGDANHDPLTGAIYYPEGGYVSDDFNRNLTDQARAQACRLALRIPELRIPNQIQGVVDLYDVTDDWIPIF